MAFLSLKKKTILKKDWKHKKKILKLYKMTWSKKADESLK